MVLRYCYSSTVTRYPPVRGVAVPLVDIAPHGLGIEAFAKICVALRFAATFPFGGQGPLAIIVFFACIWLAPIVVPLGVRCLPSISGLTFPF